MEINSRHIILAGLLFVAGIGLLLLPMRTNVTEADAPFLMEELNDNTRFFSTDEVARMIIEGDPTLLLVDLREQEEFESFTLPGAMNIPFRELLAPEHLDLLSDPRRSIILFSNGDVLPERAWLLLRRLKAGQQHILRGGLNAWAETILRPTEPPEAAPAEELSLYSSRLGARQYFTGGSSLNLTDETRPNEPEQVNVLPRPRKTAIEGGC